MQLSTTIPRVIAISVATVFFVTTLGAAVYLWTCASCNASFKDWLLAFIAGNAVILAAPGWIIMATGLVIAVKNMFVMTSHVNDSFQNANWMYRLNRFNLIYAPRYLTEDGIAARTKVLRGFLMFFFGAVMWVPLMLIIEYGA